MITINEINRKARPLVFNGVKVPHNVSNPVICEEDGKYYIAYFGFTYSKENLLSKNHNRPSRWILVDIETGELVKSYLCKDNDFSKQPSDVLYSLDDPDVRKPDAAYFKSMDYFFDIVRASIISGNPIDMANYKAYLSRLYLITPVRYRIFYKELSINV